jgi:hypothetical protein
VRRAFRLLFARDRGTLAEGVERVAAECASAPAQRLLAFVRGESKRGLAGRPRGARESD